MKKTLTLMAFIIATSIAAHAQKKTTISTISTSNSTEKPRSYLGLAGGVNNISGLGGITFETPLSENVSAKLGLGIGGWGVKLGLAGKYYRAYATSWAFGAGYSTALGLKDFVAPLSLAANPNLQESVKLSYIQAHMVDLVAGKSWGKKVKFNLELGYSIKVAGGNYVLADKTQVLSDVSKTTLRILSPGGLIIGMGLMFRL
jgi:hypothetical protein